MTLIERERELERIEAHLAHAAEGSGSALLIEGPPGIGKSALLGAASELAGEREVAVLSARADELERAHAFGVVRQLLEPRLLGVDAAARDELLAGAARLACGPLGLDSHGPGPPPPPGAELHGLYWLCANLADRGPLLLAIDDLHWADEPSLRFLAYLAGRAKEHPVLICASSRPTLAETHGPLAAAVGTIWSEVLEPRELTEAGVERLVGEALSTGAEPEFSAACARATGGNPFLLFEALAALRDDGIAPVAGEVERVESLRPQTLSRVLLLRIALLGPSAARVAHAVATLGADAALRRVARLAEIEPEASAAAIAELRREGILAEGEELRFVHPLVRNVVDADLAVPARGLAHLRAARLLDDEGEEAARVARHLLAAEPSADPWVVGKLREAAREALSRGAPEAAVAALERALDEPPPAAERPALELDLGRALARAGRLKEAAEAMRRALALTEDPRDRVEIALELAGALQLSADWPGALEVLEESFEGLTEKRSELALRLEMEIVFTRQTMLRPAGEWLERLEAAAGRGEESPASAMAMAILAFTGAGSGSMSAEEVARLALRASRASAEPLAAGAPSPSFWIPALAIAGRPAEALEAIDRGIEAASRSGAAPQFSFLSLSRSRVALEAGRALEAEADARAALNAFEGGATSLGFAVGVLVMALVERGLLEEADEQLAAHGLDAARGIEALPDFVLLQARGMLRLAQGRCGEAVEDLEGCGAMLTRIGFTNPAFSGWRGAAALAHRGLEQRDPARRLAAEELELARAFGAPRAIGVALRAMGLVEGGERGIELLRESVAVLEDAPAKLEHARSVIELGSALRREGQRRDSRDPLRRGLDLAGQCGATALAERASEELAAAGARPRRAATTGPEALTASELRVVRLAVQGMTNREIAQALFITRRTVEVHLTSAYRKLEIGSREELGDALKEPQGQEGGVVNLRPQAAVPVPVLEWWAGGAGELAVPLAGAA